MKTLIVAVAALAVAGAAQAQTKPAAARPISGSAIWPQWVCPASVRGMSSGKSGTTSGPWLSTTTLP